MNPIDKLRYVVDKDVDIGKAITAMLLMTIFRGIVFFLIGMVFLIAFHIHVFTLIPLISISIYLLYRWTIS
jgi:hypothetical protein